MTTEISSSDSNEKPCITGEVVEVLPCDSGRGTDGGWYTKQQIIIRQPVKWANKLIAVTIWNKLVGTIAVGDTVTVTLKIEARKYEGKNPAYQGSWLNMISAIKIIPINSL
jgi:hypothetical protein